MRAVALFLVERSFSRKMVAGRGLTLCLCAFAALCLSLTLPQQSKAQEDRVTVQGSVVDSTTGERIPYATVMVAGTSIGTMADINGYFILRNISPKNLKLRVSAIGFETKEFDFGDLRRKGTSVQLELPQAPKALPTVTVMGERAVGPASLVSSKVITAGELQKNVGVFKNDVVQYITQLPGVVTVSGVSSQYFVRGGGADQNLVMIDGMQVYNLSHAFGLFSFVDPLIVKVADFSAGGFQAQYGGRLSSVFDIQTIDGDSRHFSAAGTFDLLSSDLKLTGPLTSQGNSSFVLFYRRPLYQNVLNKFYSLGLPFSFYDGFGKMTTNFAATGHISAEFLASADKIASNTPDEPDFTWNNYSGAVSGNYLFGDQYNMKFEISISSYKAEQVPKQSNIFGYQLSQISNPSVYGSITSYTESRNEITFGFLFKFPSYHYTFTNTYGSTVIQSESQVEPDFWMTYNLNISRKLSVEAGFRSDLQRMFTDIAGSGYGYLAEPRVSVSYNISRPISVYAAYGLYHQRLIDLNNENMVYSPFDLLAPIADTLGDEAATHYIVGVSLSPNILTTVKLEAYYKDFSRLIAVNRDKVYGWEPDFFTGTGEAFGLDLSFKYDTERYYLEGNYSYGKTTRTLNGETYYPRYDLRHQLNLSAGYQPVNKLWLRAKWKITSGLPYTPIMGFYGIITPDPYHLPGYVDQRLSSQVSFGKLNTSRLPGYQSLDLSASYDLLVSGVHLTLTGTVINLYNKRNVFYINNVTGDVVYQLPTVWNLSLGWGI